ncbi:ATP-binding protein [Streptomyces sp. NPDC056663]|uniref:ATP-binding protein n=1 Tax=Streptomyces sp. NPDC056663 TaxID=3345899 RepID=UPI00368B52CC
MTGLAAPLVGFSLLAAGHGEVKVYDGTAGTPVRIGVGARDGFAVLEFHDDGPGMTADQAERAFDRFYRADKARARAQVGGGAGLGLLIADSLVRAHGGRIEIHTSAGAGARGQVRMIG